MRIARLLALLGLGMTLAGCVAGSLQPLFTDKEVIFDPGLLGKWQEVEVPDPGLWTFPVTGLWTFTKAENQAYRLTIEQKTDRGGKDRTFWEAHLVSLGMYTFFDLCPAPLTMEKQVVDKYGYVGLHNQFLVRREKDTFYLAVLNWDWVENQIAQGKVHLSSVELENQDRMLTASTQELQQFYASAARDPEAFTELVVLKRLK